MVGNIVAVALGAAFGALIRWCLGVVFAQTLPWIALGTLLANWVGALLIGISAVLFETYTGIAPYWKLLLITGFLGGLTTFSGFSLEVVAMLQVGRYGVAVSTCLLHVLGSLFFTVCGMMLVQWLLRMH